MPEMKERTAVAAARDLKLNMMMLKWDPCTRSKKERRGEKKQCDNC